LPRRDKTSRVSTSAGDSLPVPTSMATLWRTTSGVSGWPPATIATSSESTRSASATSAGSPESVTALPRACRSAARNAFECAQVFVSGTEQAHDELGRNVDAAANLRCRRTSSVGLAGVTWFLMPAFCGWAVVLLGRFSLPPRG